jgi:hypothetical protein
LGGGRRRVTSLYMVMWALVLNLWCQNYMSEGMCRRSEFQWGLYKNRYNYITLSILSKKNTHTHTYICSLVPKGYNKVMGEILPWPGQEETFLLVRVVRVQLCCSLYETVHAPGLSLDY